MSQRTQPRQAKTTYSIAPPIAVAMLPDHSPRSMAVAPSSTKAMPAANAAPRITPDSAFLITAKIL